MVGGEAGGVFFTTDAALSKLVFGLKNYWFFNPVSLFTAYESQKNISLLSLYHDLLLCIDHSSDH